MNILIVDDEFYIVKNITENVNWQELGITNIFTAYSAAQAKKIFEENNAVDILLTDIDMPRENGLALVKWLHDNNFHPTVMMLTGHQNFKYAQEAVNLHVHSYVLKPIEIEELTKQLNDVILAAKKYKFIANEVHNIELQMADAASSDTIVLIKNYVKEHLEDPNLERQQIADAVHMNADYMSHVFSKKTGVSLSSYINEARIKKAKKLLSSPGYTLTQISDLCGFSSTSYFHRAFKKSCGVTPQQFRNSNL